MLSCFSHVQLFATLWTAAHQAPLSMGFSRQEYWSWLPCPPSGDLPDPGIKPLSLKSLALSGGFFTTSATWKESPYRNNWMQIIFPVIQLGFPDDASSKEPTCQYRRHKSLLDSWIRKILWRRAWQPTPVFLPGESHRQRSLEGYKPQGHKESDSTEETWDTHTLYNYLRKKPLEAYVIAQEIVLTIWSIFNWKFWV